MESSRFLRSINIALDVAEPSRLAHFRPTSKSANLFRHVLADGSDNAVVVVAPYGSGKSLAAGYLLHAIQNEPHRFPGGDELLDTVAERLVEVDEEIGRAVLERRAGSMRGVGASLHGHHPNTVRALQKALGEGFERAGLGREYEALSAHTFEDGDSVLGLVESAVSSLSRAKRDQLLIVWDEFGRHLEGLVAEGRYAELMTLQLLAEATSRAKGVRVTLVLLLHRSFMGYASNLPASVRQEWSKIEGRFQVLQFVDDSLEMHRLLSGVVREIRPSTPKPGALNWKSIDLRGLAEAIFRGISAPALKEMLSDSWPLEPATLWLLPRVSARVAQHERTAFSFLYSMDLGRPVTPEDVFDYFRGDFQADSGPGGTHRLWLEVESAISKVGEGSLEAKILKVAFLMGLGLSGEKSKTPRTQLEKAVAGSSHSIEDVRAALQLLLEKRLLIHRHQTDQVIVWHGTDVDLRGRLEDERIRLDASFSLSSFLSTEAPPPIWRPLAYNASQSVPRYFVSQYLTPSGLSAHIERIALGERLSGTDAEVLYVIPSDDSEYKQALELVHKIYDPRVFVVIARDVDVIRGVSLELAALLRMHQDHNLLAQDPMVRSELDLLTDDVRQTLRPGIERILYPGPNAATWYHRGAALSLRGEVDLQAVFTRTMREVYPLTPVILSEMVVRRKPSSIVINARKKVILGILERYGQESLGIEGDFADKAIFRAVFHNTGLYRRDDKVWGFARPEEIRDPGLAAVWRKVQAFFSDPGSKSVHVFLEELREPPFGVREGLVPLLFAAGLKAFPAPKALRSKALFLGDILPSTIEEICRSPEDFVLDVVALRNDEEEYLQAVLSLFSSWSPSGGAGDDLIRKTFDAVHGWWNNLPSAARTATNLSKSTRRFRLIISEPDPVAVLLRELPRAFGGTDRCLTSTLEAVRGCVRDLEGVHDRFVTQAGVALRNALQARGLSGAGNVRSTGQAWARYFPKGWSLAGLSPIPRSVLMQLRRDHEDDESLLNALALLVTGHAFKDWSDAVVPEFERRLRTALEDIEHAALEAGLGTEVAEEIRLGLVGLARARLRLALNQLASLAGESEALGLIDEDIDTLWTAFQKDKT